MPRDWEQHFDFYLGTQDGAPVSRTIDMAALVHLPVRSHPIVMRVTVPLHQPDENGLRSSDEFGPMSAIEEFFEDKLESDFDALYWGKEIAKGRTHFFAGITAGATEDMKGEIAKVVEREGYSAVFGSLHDPDWSEYRAKYPNVYFQHTMDNRRLQTYLKRQGDTLTKRRRIDHMALFPDALSANAASPRLKKSKFKVGRPTGPDAAGKYMLAFHRRDSCEGTIPDDFTAEILDCIEPNDGVYDGWGSVVTS